MTLLSAINAEEERATSRTRSVLPRGGPRAGPGNAPVPPHACRGAAVPHPVLPVGHVLGRVSGRIRPLVTRQHFDVVQVEMLHAAHSPWGCPVFPPCSTCTTSSCPRVAARTGSAPRSRRGADADGRTEAAWRRAADLSAFTDRLAVKTSMPGGGGGSLRARTLSDPNGVDPDCLRPRRSVGSPIAGVHASFTYAPNVDAMVFFCRQVLPCIRAAIPPASSRS